jgi:hypothetical protein
VATSPSSTSTSTPPRDAQFQADVSEAIDASMREASPSDVQFEADLQHPRLTAVTSTPHRDVQFESDLRKAIAASLRAEPDTTNPMKNRCR